MKRFLLTLVFLFCVFAYFGLSSADACVAPLETASDSTVSLYKADELIMQYYKMEIRPAGSYFAVTLEVAVKNNGEKKNVQMGIPYYFYSGLSKASNVAVNYKGASVKVKRLDAVKNAEAYSGSVFYNSYYCWTAEIDKDEIAYMYITFTVDQRAYENNTLCIDIPLDVLQCWSDKSGIAEIIIDSAAVSIFSYDRTPSISPSFVYSDGKLVWKRDISLYNGNLNVCHNIDVSVISKFFTNVYKSGAEQKTATLFSNRKYAEAIASVDENGLSDNSDFLFMKMVCMEKLGFEDEAYEILKSIYDKTVCFSADSRYDISEYTAKRMLYSYYCSITDTSQAMLKHKREVLTEGLETLSDSRSSVFITWVNSEIKTLNSMISAYSEDDGQTTIEPTGNLTTKIWFGKISEPVIIAVGAVLIVVVIFCVTGMLSGKKKTKKTKTRNIKM